jgi:hypothetical protein
MSNKKEHECARSASRIRRANEKKTKNQIKTFHYFRRKDTIIISFYHINKTKKKNSLKLER